MAKSKLFSALRKRDIFLVIVIIIAISGATYIWTNHHLQVRRAAYSLQKPFVSIRCSDNTPSFMAELMQYTLDTQKSLNNQLAYRVPNGEIYHCESGWEDGFRGDKLLSEHSRMRYASVTKVFTSALILQLINDGKLSLQDKVVDILQTPPPEDPRINNITIAMLLEHSGGFDRFKTYTPMLTAEQKPWCPTNLDELANTTLDFDPGTQFQYSNLGYCLLGAIIEKTSGLSFRDAAEQAFALNKYDLRFVDNDFLPGEIQYDYRYENFYSDSYHDKFDFKDSLPAVAGLSGSALDLVKASIPLLDKNQSLNIFSRSLTPCAINFLDGCYGYVLSPFQANGNNFIQYGKSGSLPGVESDLFVDEYGGILAILRGASAPDYDTMIQLRKHIYQEIEKYYQDIGLIEKRKSIL